MDEQIAMPPEPVLVAVAARPFGPGVPRYRRAAPPAAPFCYICGAALPPWRASCFAHDGRQGRGLPAPIVLVPRAG